MNMAELHILSMNVKGFKDDLKRQKVLHWAKKRGADIFLTQESHFEKGDQTTWEEDWGGEIYSSEGSNNSRGVSIFIRKNLDYKVKDNYNDKEGRMVVLKIEINGKEYIFEYDAFSSTSRPIEVRIERASSPWENYSKLGLTAAVEECVRCGRGGVAPGEAGIDLHEVGALLCVEGAAIFQNVFQRGRRSGAR